MKRFVNIVSLSILCAVNCGAQDSLMHHVFRIARFQATVAGKVCGTVGREELLNAGTVDLDGYDNYKIVSFVCSVSSVSPWAKDTADKSSFQFTSHSGRFTANMYATFQSLYGVAKICFTDIFCKGPDKKVVKLNDVQLALQDRTTYNMDTTGWSRVRQRTRIYNFDVGIAGKVGGLIRKKELLDAGKVDIFTRWGNKIYFYKGPQIISFKVCAKTKKGYRARYADDENFTSSIMYIITNAKPGSRVVFRKIVILLPDGTIETKRRMVFKLKKHWFFNRDV